MDCARDGLRSRWIVLEVESTELKNTRFDPCSSIRAIRFEMLEFRFYFSLSSLIFPLRYNRPKTVRSTTGSPSNRREA
jgi:hypothetical protein